MNVLVDTCVWSLFARRQKPGRGAAAQRRLVDEMVELIREGRVMVIGPIRQEFLSGVKDARQFETLCQLMEGFADIELETADYELAARFFNTCRSKGVQGTNVDLLICAVAHRRSLSVYTTDKDFKRYGKCIPLTLHEPRTKKGR